MRLGLAISLCSPQSGGVAFTPLTDAGLKAWYDFSLGATTGGGNITALADQSGTGDANKNLTKVGAGNITYTASDAAYGGKSTGSFPGTGERMDSAGLWAASLPQPLTIYAVGHATNAGGRIVDGTAGARAIVLNNSGLWSTYGGAAFVDAAASTPGSPTKVCAVLNGASSAIYIGGTFAASAGTGNAGADTVTRLSLGDLFGGGGPLNGKIAAVIVSSGAHNATLRAQYAAYLLARFGF